LKLNVLFAQGGRRSLDVADSNGCDRQALDHPAICTNEVGMSCQIVLRASGLEAPDMVSQVRAASQTDPDDIEQISVQGGSVPRVVRKPLSDIAVTQRRGGGPKHAQNSDARAGRTQASASQRLAEIVKGVAWHAETIAQAESTRNRFADATHPR